MSANPSNFNATVFNKMITRRVETKGGAMRTIARMATGDLYRAEGKYPLTQGGGLPTKITTRAPVTPNSEIDYTMRTVSRDDYHDSMIIDRGDLDRMQSNPRDAKWDALMGKFERLEDFIYQSSALGAALGGATGTTSTAFDTDNIIPVTLGAESGFTNAGFTYEKLKTGIKTMGNNDALKGRKPCCVISYEQWDDIMGQDKFINNDFTSNRMVDKGSWDYVPNFLGVDFIVTNILPYMNTGGTGANVDMGTDVSGSRWNDTDTTDIRACILTTRDSTLLEIKPDIYTNATPNPSLSYRDQIYAEMGLGAVRMQEELVYILPCDQSPAAA